MSEFKINCITNKLGTSGPVIAGVSTNNSTGCMIIPAGPTERRGPRSRGVFGGGSPSYVNIMNFITISTTGNAEDFGDLIGTRRYTLVAVSNKTRGIIGGGGTPTVTTSLDYFTISTQGNSSDFGDMTVALTGHAALSDVNGGLGD